MAPSVGVGTPVVTLPALAVAVAFAIAVARGLASPSAQSFWGEYGRGFRFRGAR